MHNKIIDHFKKGNYEKAEELAELSPNIMIKVPGTAAGYEVIEKLTGKGIPTNNTLCFVYFKILQIVSLVVKIIQNY